MTFYIQSKYVQSLNLLRKAHAMSSSSDSHTVQVRMPKRLWERFNHACRSVDTTASESIREYVRAVVREHSVEEGLRLDAKEEQTRAAYTGLSPQNVAQENYQRANRDSKALWHPNK